MSNIDLINRWLGFSKTGPMTQLVAMHALESYCEGVVENEAQLRQEMQGGFISADAWIAACREFLQLTADRRSGDYGRVAVEELDLPAPLE